MTIAYSLCTMASSKWNLSPLWLRWMKMKLRSSSSPTCNVTETLGRPVDAHHLQIQATQQQQFELTQLHQATQCVHTQRTKVRSDTCKSTVSQQAAINIPLGCLHCCTRLRFTSKQQEQKPRHIMPQEGVINTPTSSQGCSTSRIIRSHKGNHATAAQHLVNAVASTAP